MNWEYISNWKTDIFKNNCWKKKLCFHYEKKKHQVKKCRNLQQEKSVKIQTQIITTEEIYEKNDVKIWDVNNIIQDKI